MTPQPTSRMPYDAEAGRARAVGAASPTTREWDFVRYADSYPLLLHVPYFDLYRRQVVKQADLVLAMHWCGDRFTAQEKARNVDYYERRTVRDSSLSAATQAVLAAEVGHLDLAFDYVVRGGCCIDLLDLQMNSKDGLHMASLAGAWLAMVAGFGGFRDDGGVPSFDPALPEGLTRMRLARWQGLRLTVDVRTDEVTYALRDGGASAACCCVMPGRRS